MNIELSKRLRLLASVVSVLVLVALAMLAWLYHRFRASLPQIDGTAFVPGLVSNTTVERDNLGVPTIRGGSRADVARALGFVHAQDRFFQMDAWRRASAGELAAVFGASSLPHDRAMRMHGFRRLAQQTVAQLPADERAVLDAYADGVNAGLAALHDKPFEYLVARARPEPWKPEDTILVSDTMLIDLQDHTGDYGRTLMTLRDQFGEKGLAFFAPVLTPADAALDGSSAPVPAIPGPDVINLRSQPADVSSSPPSRDANNTGAIGMAALPAHPRAAFDPFGVFSHAGDIGSNAFALAGNHTANGAALLASDIHLALRVPNDWYRASLHFPNHTITGITLPGTPLIIAGSNGHVAWSFTNAYADTGDLVTVDVNPVAPTLYRVPGTNELQEIEHRHEVIAVHGGKPVSVDYDWTIWGPVVGHDEDNHLLAYLWTGHDPTATNLGLLRLEDATDARAAVALAHDAGIPVENIVIADAHGAVAWTIAGKLPRRVGYDGRLPVTFQYGDRKWDGYVPPGEVPVVISNPAQANETSAPDGRIWSANQRMLGGDALTILGDGGYGRPNRAAQIRDDLAKLEHATPADLLAVQLDDRALFLARWHTLLLDVLTPKATAERKVRGELRSYVEKWEGRASIDAVSYPVVRLFRLAVYGRVFQPIFRSCREEWPDFSPNQLLLEGAVWKILTEKPENLLPRDYASWDALLLAAVDDVLRELDRNGVRLKYATWGEHNRAQIRHPFSYTLPWLFGSLLDMPADPLPGDHDMPRVQEPAFGASERMVVSPGHEDEGIFEMPCGQSGHPLSPFYRAGHEAWVKGEPTPFLPGKTVHTLTLTPGPANRG